MIRIRPRTITWNLLPVILAYGIAQDLPLLFELSSDNLSEFCETETFNATCSSDHVILISSARYGRMQLSRCVKLDYGHIGCSTDVTSAADARCSGRRKCEIRVPDAEFGKNKPCPDDLKPYLEIGYSCVKVVKPPFNSCTHPGPAKHLVAPSSGGVIASLVSDVTGCGRLRMPWRIDVHLGQVIHVTLYDFGVHGRRRAPASDCVVYAVLWEPTAPEARNATVCGGTQRHLAVYMSTTHLLKMAIANIDGGHHLPYFLLHYQAVGCADLPPLPNAWSVRNGEGAMIRCNFTKDVYHLRCSGNRWIGDLNNCSSASFVGASLEKGATSATMHIPYGLSVAIVLIIAFTIGLFVLFAGLFFLKRQRNSWTAGRESPDHRALSSEEPADKTYASRSIIINAPSRDSFSRDATWRGTLPFGNHQGPHQVNGPRDACYAAVTAPRFRLTEDLKNACGCQAYMESVETPAYQPCYPGSPAAAALPARAQWPAEIDRQIVQYYVVGGDQAVEASSPTVSSLSHRRGNGASTLVRSKYALHQTDDVKLRTRGEGESSSLVGLVDLGSDVMPQIVAECKPLMSGSERLGGSGDDVSPFLSPTRAYSTMTGKGLGVEREALGKGEELGWESRELIGEGGSGTRQFESVN